MKHLVLLVLFSIMFLTAVVAQVSISSDSTAADSSAMLDVKSANKGFLPPRVFLLNKADTTTIKKPATGLMVYNTNTNLYGNGCCTGIFFYNGVNWLHLATDPLDTIITAIFQPISTAIRQTSDTRFQTFTATQTGNLQSIAIYSTGSYRGVDSRAIELYNGEGVGGTLLATLTLPGNHANGYNWEVASFPASSIQIKAGSTYTIVTSEHLWVFDSGNPYLGGYSNSPESDDDYGFRILVVN